MGEKDEAIKIVTAQSGAHIVANIEFLFEKIIPKEGLILNEEQAEEMANTQVSMMNQRLFTEYHEDEWEGSLPDRDTN